MEREIYDVEVLFLNINANGATLAALSSCRNTKRDIAAALQRLNNIDTAGSRWLIAMRDELTNCYEVLHCSFLLLRLLFHYLHAFRIDAW